MAKGFRIVTDEPQGICVGFEPPAPYNEDPIEVTEDDGGEFLFLSFAGAVIHKERQLMGSWAEPDAIVWRTPEAFAEWLAENE